MGMVREILIGLTRRLDYLTDILGINAIWISPFYESPMIDNGYDVRDYYVVDSLSGRWRISND